jgi:hypothetical protein
MRNNTLTTKYLYFDFDLKPKDRQTGSIVDDEPSLRDILQNAREQLAVELQRWERMNSHRLAEKYEPPTTTRTR